MTLHKNIKFASANTLKLCVPNLAVFKSHTKINNLAKRALPEKMCLYNHVIVVYKQFQKKNKFVQLNLSDQC